MSSAASSRHRDLDDFGGGKGRGLLNPVISASSSEETDDEVDAAKSSNKDRLESMLDQFQSMSCKDGAGGGASSASAVTAQVTDNDLAEALKLRLNLSTNVDDGLFLVLAKALKDAHIKDDASKQTEDTNSNDIQDFVRSDDENKIDKDQQEQKENSNSNKKNTVPLGDYFSKQNESQNKIEDASVDYKKSNETEDQDDTVITEPVLQSPNFTSPLGGGRRGSRSRRGSNPRQRRGRSSTNRVKTPDVSVWKKPWSSTSTPKDPSLTQSTHGVAFESKMTPPRGNTTSARPTPNNTGRNSPIPPTNRALSKSRSPLRWNLFGPKNAANASNEEATVANPVPATPPVNTKLPSPPPTGDFPSPENDTDSSSDTLPSFPDFPMEGQPLAGEEESSQTMSMDNNTPTQSMKNPDSSTKTWHCNMRRKNGTTPPPPPAGSPLINLNLNPKPTKKVKSKTRPRRKKPSAASKPAPQFDHQAPAAAAPIFEQTVPNVMFPKTAPVPVATRFRAPDITPPPPINAHVPPAMSPMDVDSEGGTATPSNDSPFTFSIGTSDNTTSPSRRLLSPSSKGPASRKLRSRRKQQGDTTPRGGLFKSPPSVPASETAATINTSQSLETAPTTETVGEASQESDGVDYSGKNEMIKHLRTGARQEYINGNFLVSIEIYTKAIAVYRRDFASVEVDDVRAVLHANRAAALLMVGANAAAATDCEEGLRFVSNHDTGASDSGVTLKGKLFTRLGKACLKLGQLDKASHAFDQADSVASNAEAVLGKTEVKRCQEAIEGLKRQDDSGCIPSPFSPDAGARRTKMQALVFVNHALNVAYGDISLHEKKISLLAAMKRWREVARHCERFAADRTKMDGVFVGDLEDSNPYPRVNPAKHLRANFFDAKEKQTPLEYEMLKLNREASAEAVLRLPDSMVQYYLRALRLEERYAQAKAANHSLSTHLNDMGAAFYQRDDHASRFAWLSLERNKLNRTISGKDRGDTAFKQQDYSGAAECYGKVLLIDAEGEQVPPGENTPAGGRLHAVLHCNRAACFMQLKEYKDAIRECSAALKIHSHYMKAILRRSRCYAKLEHYQESISEYKKYLELVEEAKKSPGSNIAVNAPCLFENPADVSDKDVLKTKKELDEVIRKKKLEEENARRREEYQRAQQRRQYNETFGAGRNHEGEAHRRREQWYNQQNDSSRRWDSFNGASPNPKARANAYARQDSGTDRRQQQQEQYNRSRSHSSRRAPKGSPGSDESRDHYSVLGIERNASAAIIKKAYRGMALMYHPDKNRDPAAPDMFRRVKLAYETLSDEDSKRKYDSEIRWSHMYSR